VTGRAAEMVVSGLRPGKALSRSFFDRDPVLVAPELLGKVLRRGVLEGRIVEVEAYRGSSDAASHAFGGKTARNATMFGPPGSLYVYFTYGMHHCANAVCGPKGEPGAVLIRALAPLAGLDEMAARRFGGGNEASGPCAGSRGGTGARRTARPCRREDLCSGPAKLCQAFALDRSADGYDLVSGVDGVMLVDDGTPPPSRPAVGTRIGLGKSCAARTEPWRWWVPGDSSVSRQPSGS
jgi:DNA-3-methyladenine glycosylase